MHLVTDYDPEEGQHDAQEHHDDPNHPSHAGAPALPSAEALGVDTLAVEMALDELLAPTGQSGVVLPTVTLSV